MALLATMVTACDGEQAGTQRALAEAQHRIAAVLPAPYFEDLVTESVAVEGDALVQVIRSPGGNAARTRASPRFAELRSSEQGELLTWCLDPRIQPLRSTRARLVRRFVDAEDGLFFEVSIPARDCPPSTPPATSQAAS